MFFSTCSNRTIHFDTRLTANIIQKLPPELENNDLTDADLLQAALDQSLSGNFRAFSAAGDASQKIRNFQHGGDERGVRIPPSRDFIYAVEVLEATAASLEPPLHRAVRDGSFQGIQPYLTGVNAIQMSALDEDTPLMLAVRCGHALIVDTLLHHGADVNRERYGLTPVMLAAKMGNSNLIQILVEHDANVNLSDPKGNSALIYAAQHGDADAVRTLLHAHADIHAADYFDNTPLMHAIQSKKAKAVFTLLEFENDVRAVNKQGMNALMMALRDGNVKISNALLHANSGINTSDVKGNTALMYAVESKNAHAVRLLLQAGNDVNAANRFGMTALMMAARGDNLDIVKALLDANANINMVDMYRRCASWYASLDSATWRDGRVVRFGDELLMMYTHNELRRKYRDYLASDKCKIVALLREAEALSGNQAMGPFAPRNAFDRGANGPRAGSGLASVHRPQNARLPAPRRPQLEHAAVYNQAAGAQGLRAPMAAPEVRSVGTGGSARMDAGAAMEDIPAAASAVAQPAHAAQLLSLYPREARVRTDGMLMGGYSPELRGAHGVVETLSASVMANANAVPAMVPSRHGTARPGFGMSMEDVAFAMLPEREANSFDGAMAHPLHGGHSTALLRSPFYSSSSAPQDADITMEGHAMDVGNRADPQLHTFRYV